ncbi:MAG: DUF1552 domain-containing protein [Planctomycetota bacterium]|nr:DUF1552 domain-containing protein [Planctomycetota bacterium]MDA1164057.1 DUF1552 domain-containing protein [Planctomycetota bacterium]
MASKSWHLDRRTFLRGTGAALGLPLMHGMLPANESKAIAELPRRLNCFYFPFGVCQKQEWDWFPTGDGKDFQFSKTLSSLEPLRDDVTVMDGISHPKSRSMPGHDTGDTFLTGASMKSPDFQNTISLDQFAAAHIGDQTRYASLTLSSDGGIGEPTRTRTMSYSRKGQPIPAMSDPQKIFAMLFGASESGDRARLQRKASMLDRVLEDARSFRRRLGQHDTQKLDEYLTSVRSVEQGVQRSQTWLDTARPNVDPKSVNLDVTPEQPVEFIRAMYDLLYLAVQTDSTRLTTYQIGQNLGAAFSANVLPKAVGLSNWHGLGHKSSEPLARFHVFLTQELSRYLSRLKETKEADGSLLDRTIVFYGSGNAATHGTTNYPIILAGGRALGMRHGQYLKFTEKTPLSNLFVTMLQRLNVPADSFADSDGDMSELLA